MNQFLTRLNHLVTIVSTCALMACTAMSGQETAGEYLDDATITTKVKAAIVDEPSLHAFQIGVETFKNEVQLSGVVHSYRQKLKAGEIAQNTRGVHSVKNDLRVR
jgi:osmotically-inducible protein OsmY